MQILETKEGNGCGEFWRPETFSCKVAQGQAKNTEINGP